MLHDNPSLEELATTQRTEEESKAVNSWVYRFIVENNIYAGEDKVQFGPLLLGKKIYAYYRIWFLQHKYKQTARKYALDYTPFMREFTALLKLRSPDFKKIDRRYFRLTRGCFSHLQKPTKRSITKYYSESIARERAKKEEARKAAELAKPIKPPTKKRVKIEHRRAAIINRRKEFFKIQSIKAAFDAQKRLFYGKKTTKKVQEKS